MVVEEERAVEREIIREEREEPYNPMEVKFRFNYMSLGLILAVTIAITACLIRRHKKGKQRSSF